MGTEGSENPGAGSLKTLQPIKWGQKKKKTYACRWSKEGRLNPLFPSGDDKGGYVFTEGILDAQSEWKFRERFAFLLSADRVQFIESGTKNYRFTFSTLVRESGTFWIYLWSVIIVCRLDWIGKWDFARFFWYFLRCLRETQVRELIVPQW